LNRVQAATNEERHVIGLSSGGKVPTAAHLLRFVGILDKDRVAAPFGPPFRHPPVQASADRRAGEE
jgi:hypothetical protein